jgi:hypothetical protein
LNVWSLLVCSDTLSSKWVNIPGRIWLDGIGDSEVPVTFANGTLKFILDPFAMVWQNFNNSNEVQRYSSKQILAYRIQNVPWQVA